MTIVDTDVVVSYDGNGVTTQFAITQSIQSKTQIQVVKRSTLGVETILVETTHFTFQAIAIPTYITMLVAPAVGERLVIRRVTPLTQTADYIPTGPFPAATHEAALDRIVQMVQETSEEVGRAFKVKVSADEDPAPIDEVIADSVLTSNSDGTALTWTPLTDFITGEVDDGDIGDDAEIALSKLAPLTASRAVVSDSDGFLAPSATTSAELGHVAGVTSAIQTQLNAKQTTTLTNGNILVGNGSNVATSVTMNGDATINGTGGIALNNNVVTNAKLAQMATATIKGNSTGGTANAADLTGAQVTALLSDVVGDSGAGGTKGLVPAPAAGDTAANKFLFADGSWQTPPGTGDTTGAASSTDNAITRFDGVTGLVLQNSAATLSDAGVISTAGVLLTGLTASRAVVTDGSKNLASSAVTDTELGYVAGATSNLQTQIDTKITENAGAIVNADVNASAAIDATKIADGSVTNAEFQRLASIGSAAVGVSDSQTLTNKVIDGDDNTVQDLPVTALKTDAGAASTFISRDGSGVPISTKAVPAGAVVGTTDAQVITLKDIDGGTATDTSRFTVPKATKATLDALTRKEATIVYGSDTDKLYVDDGSNLIAVGAGAGVGFIDYITNYDFEINTSGWATYLDAAAVTPVDGTGGSPSSTFARNTTTPLIGAADAVWTKSAANRQGEGFSYAFTIDNAYKSRQMGISFNYATSSGYVDADMRVFILDVTNSVLIEPSVRDLAGTPGGTYQASWQASATSTSYRLIVHTASVSAVAYTVNIDNVVVGPTTSLSQQAQVSARVGAAGTQAISSVAVTKVTAWDTLAYDTGSLWDATNDQFVAPVAGKYLVTYAIAATSFTTTEVYRTYVFVNGAAVSEIRGTDTGTVNFSQNTINVALNKGDTVDIRSESSADTSYNVGGNTSQSFFGMTLLSADGDALFDNREISFHVNKGGSGQTGIGPNAGGFKIDWSNKVYDTANAFDLNNERFVAPVSGRYHFDATVYFAGGNILANGYQLSLYKNGAAFVAGQYRIVAAGSPTGFDVHADIDLVKGEYIEVYIYGDGNNSVSTITAGGATTLTHFAGHKINTVVASGAKEKVFTRVTSTAAGTIGTGVGNVQVLGTVETDTHGVYNTTTGVWTAPRAGAYEFSLLISTASVNLSTSQEIYAYIKKNGSIYAYGGNKHGTGASVGHVLSMYTAANLNKGDTIEFWAASNVATARSTASATSSATYASID